jgi:hypothetical protein
MFAQIAPDFNRLLPELFVSDSPGAPFGRTELA